MKKVVFFISLALILLSTVTFGQLREMTPSTLRTASANILDRPGYFHGLSVDSDGTNAVTIDAYDNITGTATGRRLMPTWRISSSATNRTHTYGLYPPVRAFLGITIIMTVAGGGTASYIAYY